MNVNDPDEVIDAFGGRCGNFPCANQAITVHEIVPRSRMPKRWREFDNRIPLCNDCHLKIHNEGTRRWEERLRKARLVALKMVE